MKKFTKCVLRLVGLGAVVGGTFAYLQKKGYVTVSKGSEDEDYDDFSCTDCECGERTYIHVDTDAMKEKAKEVAQEMKEKASEIKETYKEQSMELKEKAQDKAEDWAEELKDKAEDAYDGAKKMAGAAANNVAGAIEKAWYEAGEQVEKVEEFFNDED